MQSSNKLATMLLVIFGLLSITGCSVASKEEDLALQSTVKSCCTSLKQLPKATPALDVNEITLDNKSPHFDFGFGLTPFYKYSLDTKKKYKLIKSFSMPRGSSVLLAGDGRLHYADVVIIFFDINGQQIASVQSSNDVITTHGALGYFCLTRYTMIPDNAETFVITTSSRNVANNYSIPGVSPGNTFMVGGLFISTPDQGTEWPSKLSIYGNVVLELNDEIPTKN
jgi:hypothetical protein